MFNFSDIISFSLPAISLPTIPLPANLQRRFLSFLLQRTLGHLVKPGQLDTTQIEAQISGGKVEIKDVELDPQAINFLLDDLPLQLQDGAIGKVAAQIPLPNIFTAPFALSLSSLHLTFALRQPPSTAPPADIIPNLAESVTSAAETFIHDELTERENRILRDSVHGGLEIDDEYEQQPPGSINPYLDDDDDDGDRAHRGADFSSDQLGGDAKGASYFAMAVESLLGRFSFTATDTQIRIIHPGQAEYTLRIPEIAYATEEEKMGETIMKVWTVRISGVMVSTKSLRPPTPPTHLVASVSSLFSDTEELHSSSSSSGEDEIPTSMYQSTASLYQSAISVKPASSAPSSSARVSPVSVKRPSLPLPQEPMDEVIFSLASEPIVIKIKNVFPLEAAATPVFSPGTSPSGHAPTYISQDTARVVSEMKKISRTSIDVAVGVISAALRSRHLQGIMASVLFVLPPSGSTTSSSSSGKSESGSPQMQFQLRLQGVMMLLLQDANTSEEVLQRFFEHPLSFPIPTRHIRIHMDTIEASLADGSLTPTLMTASHNINTSSKPVPSSVSTRQVASLTITDLSIFTISRQHHDSDSWTSSPILIHDANLPYQYDASTPTSFPTFEVSDWRKSEGRGGRPSLWKAHVAPHNKRRLSSSVILGVGGPAILARTELGVRIVEVVVQPLHVFVDLDNVHETLPFVLEILTPLDDLRTDSPTAVRGGDTHSTPKAGFAEIHIMGDPDDQNAKMKEQSLSAVVVECPMVRVQIRVPPPPSVPRSPAVPSVAPSLPPPPAPRSGSIVFDIHTLRAVTGESGQSRQQPSTRFAASQESSRRSSRKKLVTQVEWNRILISLAGVNEPRASAMVSLGPSSSKDRAERNIVVFPVVYIRRAPTVKEDEAQSMSIECRIPSVHVKIDKLNLDGLQFWADDVAQWADRTFNPEALPTGTSTGNTSLIGSRYFAHTPKGMGSFATTRSNKTASGNVNASEIVISVVADEATVRLLVPRGPLEGTMDARPMSIFASDVDALVEIKPEGKNETVVSLSVADMNVADTSATGEVIPFLELTDSLTQVAGSRPLVKVRITSAAVAETTAKKSTIAVTATGFTYTLSSDIDWISDVARFAKAPPGAFEAVVPSERTGIWLKVHDGSVRVVAPQHKGALVAVIKELEFLAELVSESIETELQLRVPSLSVLFIDDAQTVTATIAAESDRGRHHRLTSAEKWMALGYAYIVHVSELNTRVASSSQPVSNNVDVDRLRLSLHLCADTMDSVGAFVTDFSSAFKSLEVSSPAETPKPTLVQVTRRPKVDMMASVDEDAFRMAPEVDTPGDLMKDDLPTNLDYLDAAYGTAGGVTAYSDEDDFGDFSESESSTGPATPTPSTPDSNILPTNVRAEAIRVLNPGGLNIVEDYFDTVIPVEDETGPAFDYGLVARVRAKDCEVKVHLHDGYDWSATRKAIEEEVRAMRRKLLKIRQLLASGQTPDESVEDTHAMLFNSVHIGLTRNADEMEPGELIAAIDEELNDDVETGTQSSWQSLNRPTSSRPAGSASPYVQAPSRSYRVRGKKLTRSKHSRIDVCLYNVEAEVDKLHPNELELVSRVLLKVENLEILDHIKTSTWKKFLTEIKSDAKGNTRETDSHMAKIELKMVKPSRGLANEEARLRMKFLPLRLHVDQDALDFLKAFGSFSAPEGSSPKDCAPAPGSDEIFFQHVEVFPVALKLDYKPKRVDYKALREGKTIELMNFFHFDGAEMTLRHIRLSGVKGWATVGDTLNDLWTPDVKANQLVDVISGIAPIRSVVNVGSGFADLILLPIAQYKKDGRVVRGLQKGATSFVKTTAMEAVKLGAKLATGTQVILEEAENVFGGTSVILAEPGEGGYPAMGGSPYLPPRDLSGAPSSDEGSDAEGDLRSVRGPGGAGPSEVTPHMISRYAEQPNDVREGVQAAYKSLGKNLNSAAQTILAVPIEVYEKSGNEGAMRKVVRAMPIAVLKPMIGAAEAVSKTLLGLRNTMDPENRRDTEEKYKR